MSMGDFAACLETALSLDVGLVSFLGGEPTIWPHLDEAVELCTSRGVATDLTTNGSTLSPRRLQRLRDAGLDMLNISVDGPRSNARNRKAALGKPGLIAAIQALNREGRLRIRCNAVVSRYNVEDVTALMSIAGAIGLPMSIGYAVPRSRREFDPDIHFSEDAGAELDAFCAQVEAARSAGTQIIDPVAYFQGYRRFLAGERFWTCNYATNRGWINVDPYGYLRDCTKKMNRIEMRFVELTRAGIASLRARIARGVEECNPDCYSNCAFDGAYFSRHKMRLLSSGLLHLPWRGPSAIEMREMGTARNGDRFIFP